MFGLLQVRLGRKTLKEAHIIILTFMTTRRPAVHLELIKGRSTDTFLMAFRRFVFLRGNPNSCWSDRGTNLIGAEHNLKELLNDWNIPRILNVISEELSSTFQRSWNMPRASHQKGIMESLIKTVRQALNATSKNQALTEEQCRTYLAKVIYFINQRPLYPTSNGIWESPSITPNDLLVGNHFPPPMPDVESKVNPRHLMRSTAKQVQEFRNCWMKYFAPNLLPTNKWFRKRENVRKGDLVLEIEPTPRKTWKMELVIETYPGEDDLVRKAKIKTATSVYDRSSNSGLFTAHCFRTTGSSPYKPF